jgi:hypothetical protein
MRTKTAGINDLEMIRPGHWVAYTCDGPVRVTRPDAKASWTACLIYGRPVFITRPTMVKAVVALLAERTHYFQADRYRD